MEAVSIALLLLLAVVVSAGLARMLPVVIPAPLVQIGLGFAIGMAADIRVVLEPDLFFLLLLPPLLFLDGWRIPKDALFRDLPIILELSLGLVVFTVIGAGFLIHAMMPRMPLAVAFCLAAVLSPTDPIAVTAIAERVPVPPRLMHILEGESLFNDASGLVCLRFAVAAVLTGHFSLHEAALSFAWSAGGGLVCGIAVTWVVVRVKDWFVLHFGEDAGAQVIVSLLIPFGAYLIAEHLQCSGILAAVAAGVTMTFAEKDRITAADTRLRRHSVWDAVQFAANGIVFVLLGEQMPQILKGAIDAASEHGRHTGWRLLFFVVAITLGLAALRFIWVWASLRITLVRSRARRPFRSSNWRLVAATSFAGVRGTITLAGILTLPLTLNDGTPFPAREFVIFLSASVILLSLVAASIALPLLLRGLVMPADAEAGAQEDHVRAAVYQAAFDAIVRVQQSRADSDEAGAYLEAAERLEALYANRIAAREEGPDPVSQRRMEAIEQELRLAALRGAREEAFRLARTRQAGSLLTRRIVRELDLLEMRYSG